MSACAKHADQPVVGYSQCPGCEIERLRRENEAAASTIDGLRQRLEQVEAERGTLAAHVERLTSITEKLSTVAPEYLDHLASDAAFVLREAPEASLARRDARVKAEALEEEAMGWPEDRYRECSHVRQSILESANEIRQQAEQEVSS